MYSIVFSLNITYPCPTSLDLWVRLPNPPLSRASCVARPTRPFDFGPRDVRTPSDFDPCDVQRLDSVGLRPLDSQTSGLPRTFAPLVLVPSFSPQLPFTSSRLLCQSLVRPTCDSQVVNLPAGLDFCVLPSWHVRNSSELRS